MRRIQADNGFTLIELTVALAIFALLSVMAYQGLDTAQAAKHHTEERMQSLKALQMTLVILQKDIEQMIDRPIRNAFGDRLESITTDTNYLVELTKTGQRSLLPTGHGALKRVAFQLEDNALIRLHWPTLDRGEWLEPKGTPLLKDINDITFRFLHSDEQWHEQWPPASSLTSDNRDASLIPKAIEITLDVPQWGKIKRLFMGSSAFLQDAAP